MAQAERAERLGFHSFWLPEHHFGGVEGLEATPAPLLLLAAVAVRTRRLSLGTTSYLLPVRHPVHAAAEVAVLDRLSGGRVILGVGRGFRRALFRAFDVPAAEKRDRFEAALLAMRRAWRGEPVAWDGERPVRLAPLPEQKPHPPLWVAAFGPQAVAQAGRLGLPYLASPIEPLVALAENVARHRAALREARHELPAEVPVMRTVFVSRDASQRERARQALAAQASALSRGGPKSLRRAAEVEVDDWALVGEPEAVGDAIRRLRERLGVTHLIARGGIAGVDPGVLEASLATLPELL